MPKSLSESRTRKGLTDTVIRTAKKRRQRYKLTDREGLYLAVMPTGKKVFRYEYRFHARRETLTLGTYSETGGGMTLAEARLAHAKARHMLEEGQSPAAHKRRQDAAAAIKQGTHFAGVAKEWLATLARSRSPAWLKIMERIFKNDVYPAIGSRSLMEIDQGDVLAACKPAQDRGRAYTAELTRRVIASVFQYAASRGLIDRNPARDTRGAISVPATRDRPALKPAELRSLITAIRQAGGRPGTRIAFELLLHTFVRKSELLRATWDEIDLDAAEWRIPAHRMKAREAHVVPLSTQAIALFERAKEIASGSKFVFPSTSSLIKPLSDTVLNNGLHRLGYEDLSPHGFRRTASTMLNEQGWRLDVIERQLAHRERNRIRAAYNKATFLPERKKMMQAWSDHVDATIAGAKVVPIKARA
jgi:integrase